jgi:hypothetical protein
VFEEHPPGGASYTASLPAWPLASFLGAPTLLPETVNAPNSLEFAPAFTTDGRYIGFLRVINFDYDNVRLFVWDTQTQTMINRAGVDVGDLLINLPDTTEIEPFSLSLYELPVFPRSTISSVGTVSFGLTLASASESSCSA